MVFDWRFLTKVVEFAAGYIPYTLPKYCLGQRVKGRTSTWIVVGLTWDVLEQEWFYRLWDELDDDQTESSQTDLIYLESR